MKISKPRLIWIVTHDSAVGESAGRIVKNKCLGAEVRSFYRTYHIEQMVEKGRAPCREYDPDIHPLQKSSEGISPDLIITTGTCKTKNEYGESYSIGYAEIFDFCEENNIPIIQPTILGKYSSLLLKAQLLRTM